MNKKAQGSVEHLMVYGWALAVIVIVIAALVFLINPTKIQGSACSGFTKLLVKNFQVSDKNITLVLINQTGMHLRDLNFFLSGKVGETKVTGSRNYAFFRAGDENTYVVTYNPSGEIGEKVDLSIDISYTGTDNFSQKTTAFCKGRVEVEKGETPPEEKKMGS